MAAILMAYEHVPLGFEMVIGNADVEMGKVWNLWWNIKLTDNPEAWDTEIELINKMQGELGELSIDQRLIRAQMAEFCRLHPLFPQSIEILCREIGQDRFFKPAKIGCEGRGLLDSLGHHEHRGLEEQRKEILTQYAKSLNKWLGRSRPGTAADYRIFGFLGRPTPTKIALVEKIVQVADPDEASVASIHKLAEDLCGSVDSDFKTLDRPFRCFKCLRNHAAIRSCQCCQPMLLDACLLCGGASREKRSMSDEFGHFIEENILAYCVGINSWLNRAPQHVTWPKNARHVSKDRMLRITEKIHSSLDGKNAVKEWLAACLLKTVKDNQRWHNRTELIDSFPKATSYFGEKLQKK